MVAGYVIWFVIAIALSQSVYNAEVYDVDQSREWLYRARATNDLADMAKYLNKTLEKLEGYHGNPCWYYPKADTDYDLIKDNIRECVRSCVVNQPLNDSMAYQQAVHNLQETIIELAEHVDGTSYWQFFDGGMTFLWAMWTWLWLPLLWVEARYF